MSFEWNESRIETLKSLWNEGLSTSEMGVRLGITKNAVVGKVHRLGLPKRQSPIRTPVRRVVETEVRTDVVRIEELTTSMCRWPMGEPGAHGFDFCGRSSVDGRPYCDEHCARAYVKPDRSASRARSVERGGHYRAA